MDTDSETDVVKDDERSRVRERVRDPRELDTVTLYEDTDLESKDRLPDLD